MSGNEGIRINKFLSEAGICSRREADRLVELGRVSINGKNPSTGQRVKRNDKVRVDGREVENNHEDRVYLVFNKPPGIVTTTDTKGERDNIVDYVNYPTRVFPIGRLDKDSEGLIFMTSDGDIVNKILRAGNDHEKEYEVTVDQRVTDDFVHKMSTGVPILGKVTRKCKVEQIAAFTFRITLTQGMNRQIRRMCEYFGFEVMKLKRTRIMHMTLDVGSGQWRPFTEAEVLKMEEVLKDSSNTADSKPKKKSPSSKPKKPAPPRREDRSKKKFASAKGRTARPKGRNNKGRSR
ncbi:MAG: 23S rRNA pseudouridine(2604) synthase RluF [Flavobacteriales bacterium]|nr:23S rRNA pseudouridine(2604) synthase RluF [Flavobacteriales bacterium]